MNRRHVFTFSAITALVSMLSSAAAEAAEKKASKADAAKIANAVTAAPKAVSHNASVVEMNEDGSMKVLRKGTREWTSDDPNTLGDDPMCLDPNGLAWLRAYMAETMPPEKVGFIYMLKGGWDFTKPQNGKPTITGPHVMIVAPAVKGLPGYERTGDGVNTALPYVMWKDTPYEHLMIPVR